MDILIVDPKGIWVRNKANFAFTNPDTGQLLPNGPALKVTDSAWIEMQAAIIEKIDDPTAEPEDPGKKEPAK